MSKFDIAGIVAEVQKLYNKDTRSKDMLSTGASIKQKYLAQDGVPVPSGHPLNALVGLPCVPFNKIIQFAGNPDGGKSTSSGEIMASAQKNDFIVILWDTEDKFDAQRYDKQFQGQSAAVALVKTNEILQGGEKVRKLITAFKDKYPTANILLCWDSVGGSQARGAAERELDSEKHRQPGQEAKENGEVMKMLIGLINKYPNSIAVVLVNQVYAKIGFMQKGDANTGGKKIEFHSSLIIQFKRIKVLKKVVKGVVVKHGIITRATVSKNHLSQSETSIHQLDFKITAKGSEISTEALQIDEDEE